MKLLIFACLIALALAQHGHNTGNHGNHGVHHPHPGGHFVCHADAECSGCHTGQDVCFEGTCHCWHPSVKRQHHITCANDSECTSLTCDHGAYCHKDQGHHHQTHGHCQCHHGDNTCATDTDCTNWHHCANPVCRHDHGHGHGHCHCP